MVGYYITPEQGIVSSEGRVCKEDYLAWLLQDSEEDGVFPDLDYAVAALLKLIGATERQGRSLLETHKLFYVDDRKRAFKLTYYPSKYAGLDFGSMSNHSYRSFYHMEQYRDFPHLRDSTFAYAQSQAKEAKEVGESVLKAYRKIGITKDTLTSPIKAFIKSNLYPVIPTVDQIPAEAGEFAYGCVRGNWVESFKIGSMPALDYDISGAYGYFLSELLDLRRGHWVSSPNYELEAAYGFCRGILNITAPFHPFIVGEGEMKYTPTGPLGEQYITKAEWDFINQYHIGDFDCLEGWWWIPNQGQQQYQIFKGVVNRLWSLRQNADPMMDKILKRIMAGLWGALLQTMGSGDNIQFGERFNPVYHALVESNCRLAVARAVLDNELYPSALINIAVDGIVCSSPISVDDGKLGGWRLSHKGKAIVVSSGIVGIQNKGGEEDFAITYDKLYSMITAEPKARVYRMSKVSPVTLGKALTSDRWGQLGTLETVIRTISVKEEGKRLYTKVPKCGGDLLTNIYSSEPWDISIIRKSGILCQEAESSGY